jgi:hypothetical protein
VFTPFFTLTQKGSQHMHLFHRHPLLIVFFMLATAQLLAAQPASPKDTTKKSESK